MSSEQRSDFIDDELWAKALQVMAKYQATLVSDVRIVTQLLIDNPAGLTEHQLMRLADLGTDAWWRLTIVISSLSAGGLTMSERRWRWLRLVTYHYWVPPRQVPLRPEVSE